MKKLLRTAFYVFAAFLGLGILLNVINGNDSRTATATTRVETDAASGNRAHVVMLKASEGERSHSMKGILESAGEICDTVTRTFYQGAVASSGAAMWNASCADGNSYVIQISNDAGGSTKVMSCAAMKSLANVTCFQKF